MRLALAFFIAAASLPGASRRCAAQSPSPDSERLSGDDLQLVTELTRRNMPELVEKLLADRPAIFQGYVAQAYAHAAFESGESANAESFALKAAEIYQAAIQQTEQPGWLNSDLRRLIAAEWHMELADLLMRRWAAQDLDRFDTTSGLDFNRDRLGKRLQDARRHYGLAKPLLEELVIVLRTQEERLMLLGITGRIERLNLEYALNSAWADLFAGMAQESAPAARKALFENAIARFDDVARAARVPEHRSNAGIGAGICLRELGRYEEALAALNRVLASVADEKSLDQARFEKAKCLIRSGEFDAGRVELETLQKRKPAARGAAISFHARIAPILHAYSFWLQSRLRLEGSPEAVRLEDRARNEFDRLSLRGGAWEELAGVYLSHMAASQSDPTRLTDSGLRLAARTALREEKWAEAASGYELLQERIRSLAADDAFNLGVCYLRAGKLKQAAESLESLRDRADTGDLGIKAAESAFRIRRDMASASSTKENFRALAAAAQKLCDKNPSSAMAVDAQWVGALALDELGDWAAAKRALEAIPASSPNYWSARARCVGGQEREFVRTALTTPANSRAPSARTVAQALLKYADDLERAASKPAATTLPAGEMSLQLPPVQARIRAARVLARKDVALFKDALTILNELNENADTLGTKLTCALGMADWKGAEQIVSGILKTGNSDLASSSLQQLIEEWGAEMPSPPFTQTGITLNDASRFGVKAIQGLLDVPWQPPLPEALIRDARACLARLHAMNGDRQIAARLLDELIEQDPTDGTMLLNAARLHEDWVQAGSGDAGKAEALWQRLLQDSRLRESAPKVYWEARYRWLAYQLRAGKAELVLKAVAADRAWFPELGGPPWQTRLLELADKARAESGAGKP